MLRPLSKIEANSVAGGLLDTASLDAYQSPSFWDGGDDPWSMPPWLLDGDDESSGEEIIVYAAIGNDGGGHCPTDSVIWPNFLEDLVDGTKYYFEQGLFYYMIKAPGGIICLYDHDNNLIGGYVSVPLDQAQFTLSISSSLTGGTLSASVTSPSGPGGALPTVSGGTQSGSTGGATEVTVGLAPAPGAN